MKKLLTLTLVAILALSGCGTLIVATDPGVPERGRERTYERGRDRAYEREESRGYIVFVKSNPRFDRVTIVLNDRTRFNLTHDYRSRYPRVREIRVRPGRHDIKVLFNGRVVQQRRVNVSPNRNVTINL